MTDLPQLTHALARTRRIGGHRVAYRFTLTVARRTHAFDSLLATEGQPPWTLLIALLGPKHWAHTYDVRPDPTTNVLWAKAFLGHDYRTLLDALGIGGGTTGPWPTTQLLQAADHGATKARPRTWIPPQDLPQTAHTGIEEAHKIAFLGWHSWATDPLHDGPSAKNYDKTRRLLGQDIADYCRAHHISSCWTTPDDPRIKHHDHRPTPWDQPHQSLNQPGTPTSTDTHPRPTDPGTDPPSPRTPPAQ